MGARKTVDWGAVPESRWMVIFPADHAYDVKRLIAGISVLLNDAPTEQHGLGYIWVNKPRLPGESPALVHLDKSINSTDLVVKFAQIGRMGEVCKVVRHWRDSN